VLADLPEKEVLAVLPETAVSLQGWYHWALRTLRTTFKTNKLPRQQA